MHVMHVAHWPRTGLTAVMRDIARALRDRADFTFVEFCGDDAGAAYYGDLGRYVSLGFDRDRAAALRRYRALLRADRPDVVHAHSFQPLLWAALARDRNSRLVTTVHNEYPFLHRQTPRDRLKRAAYAYAVRRGRPRLVCVSDRIADLVPRAWTRGDRPLVIENGVEPLPLAELPRARAEIRRDLHLDDDHVLLMSVGRLNEQKGFDLLLDAAAPLLREDGRRRLVIVGDGDLRDALERRIATLGLTGRATLAGWQPEPLRWLAACDLFVMSSRYEGCAVALIEAMSCEVATVSTPVGVAPRLLSGEFAALLAPEVGAGAIERTIRAALAPGFDRRATGRALSALVRRDHTLARLGERYLACYTEDAP